LLLFSALLLSRETMEQMIDESDIAERKSLDEPAGLKNVGNTCWFNSVVQTVYTLPYFRQLILNFTEELRYLFALMLKSPRRSINPDRAIKKFKNTRKLCGVDFSHEVKKFFRKIIFEQILSRIVRNSLHI
jgi:ubiquitin C-terminal hydrolase